jgi:hypothetical protein
MGKGSKRHTPAALPERDPVAIVQEAGWTPGPVWTGSENLTPTGIWSPDVQPVESGYTDYAIPAHIFTGSAVQNLRLLCVIVNFTITKFYSDPSHCSFCNYGYLIN